MLLQSAHPITSMSLMPLPQLLKNPCRIALMTIIYLTMVYIHCEKPLSGKNKNGTCHFFAIVNTVM